MSDRLRVVTAIYPNRAHYFRVMVGERSLGCFDHHTEGYLVNGKRKPVPTISAAVVQVINTRLQRSYAESLLLERLLSQPTPDVEETA